MNTQLIQRPSVAVAVPQSYHEGMIFSEFAEKALKRARYELLEDKTYFGSIPGFRGPWANAKTLKKCRKELREVFEEWMVLQIRDHEKIPGFPVKIARRRLGKDA